MDRPRVIILNGVLLRAGLADELSLIIAPYLPASAAADLLHLIAAPGGPGAVTLELTAVERLRLGPVWLRYAIAVRDACNDRYSC